MSRRGGDWAAVPRRRLVAVVVGILAVLASLRPITTMADTGYSVTTRHFTVMVGPTGTTQCDVIGDLYVPASASVAAPVPAILTTNGFGGSKDDQAAFARHFAGRGYEVLSYSGLGFGGSGCPIELDDPDWDGKAASQLISFLGNRAEVLHDAPGDPRVGMIGGSYGGGVQFSTAAIDPRLDTIIPVITWNDLAYSLTPNNNAVSLRWPDAPPGVPKWQWTELFFADGLASPPQHAATVPPMVSTCPGFDPRVCIADVDAIARGYPSRSTLDLLHHASMWSFHNRVRIPTMLMQGENDSLFNLDEAVANYNAIRANGAPAKLVFQSWGHSNSSPAPGELDWNGTGYENTLIENWFDHYLKKLPVSTGAAIEYFRDWVPYLGNAQPAYASASSYPPGRAVGYTLSNDGTLRTSNGGITRGTTTILNPGLGAAASYSETSAVQNLAPFKSIPPTDAPGTFASFTTPVLTAPLNEVGVPSVDITITSPLSLNTDPATQPTIVAKIYDVAPDGSVTLPARLVSPARLVAGSHKFTLTLPAVVHQFPAGHRLRLVLATTDAAYLTSRLPGALWLAIDGSAVLHLPTI